MFGWIFCSVRISKIHAKRVNAVGSYQEETMGGEEKRHSKNDKSSDGVGGETIQLTESIYIDLGPLAEVWCYFELPLF